MPLSPEASAVWGISTGVPEPLRSQRLVMMLQALIDESQSYGALRLFVMGGYISTVEKWAALTEEWRDALRASPTIEYFSFKEAYPASGKPSGQFRHLTVRERDEKVASLRAIIERHVLAEVGIGFRMEPYERAFVGIQRMEKNAYFFANFSLETWTARTMDQIGIKRQPLQFIFDDRDIDRKHVLESWWYAAENGNPKPPDLFTAILTEEPMFRSSHGKPTSVIALQAADMFVGWIRSSNEIQAQGGIPLQLPGTKILLPSMFVNFTTEMLQQAADSIRARNAASASET